MTRGRAKAFAFVACQVSEQINARERNVLGVVEKRAGELYLILPKVHLTIQGFQWFKDEPVKYHLS